MGRYTAVALCYYCAGSNHVLPTSGYTHYSSPLEVYNFQNRSSLIMFSAVVFFNDTATTEIYTLSLHDALPISGPGLKDQPGPLTLESVRTGLFNAGQLI